MAIIQTTSAALPKRVVRFYSNLDFALDVVSTRQIAIVHVSKFNDPFDPYFYFETDFGEDYDKLVEYVQRQHPDHFDLFVKLRPRENWPQNLAAIKRYFEKLRDAAFVFSTVAVQQNAHPKDNLYMWSHYANGHRGVAIEFDPVKMGEVLLKEHNKDADVQLDFEELWVKVKYLRDVSPVTAEMYFDFAIKFIEDVDAKSKLHRYYEELF
jgi:Protein of unknown function (DUF2971)